MDDKTKVRPILAELKGYLSVAPDPEKKARIFDAEVWNQYNSAVDELNSLNDSHDSYEKFKLRPQSEEINRSHFTIIKTQDYVGKLSGLINRIEAEYFSDEINISTPTTVINTSQTQSQFQSLAIVLELQEKIISEIPKHKEGSKERTFLEKIKAILPTVKSAMDILSSVLKIGAEIGLDPITIHKLLGL